MKKKFGFALTLALAFTLTACGSQAKDASTADLKIGQVQYAAHGTKSFAVTTVVMSGDKIAEAYIDEYQVMAKDSVECVPNSDADFGANFADETMGLASKRVNSEYYSKNMAEKAGSTVAIADNFDAIQAYAEGKTIDELEKAIDGKEAQEVIDAVSGATLADTPGYLESIIAAAKAAK